MNKSFLKNEVLHAVGWTVFIGFRDEGGVRCLLE